MEEYEKKISNIKLVKVENNEAFWKQNSLTAWYQSSKIRIFTFTDADYLPSFKRLDNKKTHSFTQQKILFWVMVHMKKSRNILNKLIRFETLLALLNVFLGKNWKTIYRVGRNMALKRGGVFKVRGFYGSYENPVLVMMIYLSIKQQMETILLFVFAQDSLLIQSQNDIQEWFTQKDTFHCWTL